MAQIKYNLGDLGKEVYSTNETIIGTWIDGKPIYRKVIDFGALPNANLKSVAHNINYIKICTKAYGMAYRDSDKINMPLPYVNNAAIANGINIYADDTKIYIRTGVDLTKVTAYIILEYTKTTD